MSPRRIQRQRTKGWRMPPNTVYVVEEGHRTDTEWTIRRRDGTWVQR